MRDRTPQDMMFGVVHKTNNCGELTILKYITKDYVDVVFTKTGHKKVAAARNIRIGAVNDPLKPVVFGLGFFGVGKYASCKDSKHNKQYQTWRGMMTRCYCNKYLAREPSYIGCTVDKRWLNFQVFAEWFDENYIDGFQLDKDIKVKGNKIYSPEACCFVSQKENVIFSVAKNYKFISPSGKIVDIYNLFDFCKGKDLSSGLMSMVHSGKSKQHKGWTKAQIKV